MMAVYWLSDEIQFAVAFFPSSEWCSLLQITGEVWRTLAHTLLFYEEGKGTGKCIYNVCYVSERVCMGFINQHGISCQVGIMAPFHREGKQSSEGPSNLPKVKASRSLTSLYIPFCPCTEPRVSPLKPVASEILH